MTPDNEIRFGKTRGSPVHYFRVQVRPDDGGSFRDALVMKRDDGDGPDKHSRPYRVEWAATEQLERDVEAALGDLQHRYSAKHNRYEIRKLLRGLPRDHFPADAEVPADLGVRIADAQFRLESRDGPIEPWEQEADRAARRKAAKTDQAPQSSRRAPSSRGRSDANPGPNPFTAMIESLRAEGLHFPREAVANYLLALQTKRFAILTGISGTGKTRIATAVARQFGRVMTRNVAKIPDDAVKFRVTPSTLKYSSLVVLSEVKKRLSLLSSEAPLADRRIGVRYPNGRHNTLPYYQDPRGMTELPLRGEFGEWFRANLKVGDRFWMWVHEGDRPEENELEIGLGHTIEVASEGIDNHVVVPVRPDWVDNRGLLGYLNPLTNQYSTTPFLDLLLRARQEENRAKAAGESPHPFFVILDEMNLARVEHYFSDFLSALESGEDIPLHEDETVGSGESESGAQIPRRLKVPGNVLFTGTVNVDETTYMFSPKVLDRAFTIEFNHVDLEGYTTGESSEDAPGLTLSRVEDSIDLLRPGSSGADDWKPSREDWVKFSEETPRLRKTLVRLNDILDAEHRHFGYRVANEIARFVNLAREQASDADVEAATAAAFDLALLQKVLPKFHGTQQELESLLERIFHFSVHGVDQPPKQEERVNPDDWTVAAGRLDGTPPPVYPRTGAKVLRMLQRLRSRGFTSFIE